MSRCSSRGVWPWIHEPTRTTEFTMRLPVVCTVVLALGLFACHESTAYVNADDLAGPSKAPDAESCNDLEQQGKEVDLSGSRESPPTPSGGAIQDGTYVLVRSTLHTQKKAHGAKLVGMGKLTMRVNGQTSQLVRD